MKVTLVQPPSNRDDTSEFAPPLGLLSVAAVLEEDEVDVALIDLNLLGLRDPGFVDADFYRRAASCIAATEPEVVGFTSMALESHICLELARLLKALDPSIRTVFGGPHFSALAEPMLRLYPWLDYVVVGEGELATRLLLRHLRGKAPSSSLVNVAFRHRGQVLSSRQFKTLASLDELPFPAYHLVDLDEYFRLNPYRVLDFEHARGCQLRCAFCYSPVHWGHGEQARRIDRVVEDVHRLHALGARHLFFVADNFVNSKGFATRLADAIATANPGVTWRCYATLAQLTDPVLDALARSQCKYVFVGVDAVTRESQARFLKSYYRGWSKLKESLQRCRDRSITPTCAFMLNPPDPDPAEAEAALSAAVHTYNFGCGIRLNPLTIYAGTGLETGLHQERCQYSDAKARLLLDGHWVTADNPYAREHPALYPFHCTVGPPEDYERFIACAHLCFTLLDHFPRTLMQWTHLERASLWGAISETVGRVDSAESRKPYRRALEVEAFVASLSRKALCGSVRDTLAFELAELRLRQPSPPREISLAVDAVPLHFRLEPHAVLRLARHPLDYQTSEPRPAGEERHPYLAVPRAGSISYLPTDASVLQTLAQVRASVGQPDPVAVAAGDVATLMASQVLQLRPDQLGTDMPTGVSQ